MLIAMAARRSTSPTVVIFDGDDTLWNTERLYDLARQRAREQVAQSGLDGAEWERLERRLDVENVSKFGFSSERFPTSCVQAYEALCAATGKVLDVKLADRIRAAAQSVFVSDPALVPGVLETLQTLRARGIRLVLLTKGDRDVQRRRIERSGIAEAFDAIRVVSEKLPETFREILGSLGASPERSWTVGNSVRSDILPALDAGLRAVWIDAHVWEHERFAGDFTDDRVMTAPSIVDVPALIAGRQMESRNAGQERR